MRSKHRAVLRFVFLLFFIPGVVLGAAEEGGEPARESLPQAQGGAIAPAFENHPSSVECKELVELLQQQKSLISRESGQLKREIAALREDIAKPGLKEIFSGLGYIFGLAGIALYIHGLKERRR